MFNPTFERVTPDAYERPLEAGSRPAERTRASRAPASQMSILIHHLFRRFFDNDAIAVHGETGPRVIQALSFFATPALMYSVWLMPEYAGPLHYWNEVQDHCFFVVYSFVVMGCVSVFEWDLLFPDLLDILVLVPLPIATRRLFGAKLCALGLLLSLFLLSANLLGTMFYFPIAPMPARVLAAQTVATFAAGIFASFSVIAMQGFLINLVGERIFRSISAWLQSISITLFLLALLLFPFLTGKLSALFRSGSSAVFFFPPFWFLGMYETFLQRGGALPIFHSLARWGGDAMLIAVLIALVTYPLAYLRRARHVLQGTIAQQTGSPLHHGLEKLLASTLIRRPAERAVYYFIGKSLRRASRHRVYVAMYAGIGMALILVNAFRLRVNQGGLVLSVSNYGLRSSLLMLLIWSVSAFRAVFTFPVEVKASWVFRVIGGQPTQEFSNATQKWVHLRVLSLGLVIMAGCSLLLPAAAGGGLTLLKQSVIVIGLAVLLTDAFFLSFTKIPFTEIPHYQKANLAVLTLLYIGVIPPLIWCIVDEERWLEKSLLRLMVVAVIFAVAHGYLGFLHRGMLQQEIRFAEYEQEEEAGDGFQRLGLSG
jgi:hypothetical protein